MEQHKKYVKVPEAAKMLDVTTMTVYRLIHDGKLRAYRPTPHRTKIVLEDVEALLSQMVVTK